MSALIEHCGHVCGEARNAPEALYLLDHQAFDLVLMDMDMPGMSGIDVTRLFRIREARRKPWRVPIVAGTCHALPSDRDRCLEAGMDAYLSKPIHPKNSAR